MDPTSELRTTAIHTRSGSIYYVQERPDGTFWLTATNIANPNSRALHDGMWQIEKPRPWPPLVGRGIWLLAMANLPMYHPDRVPGGGKYTSDVTKFHYVGEP